MTPFRIYKHKNCLDAAIIPVKAFYIKENDTWNLKVKWIIYKNDKYVRDLGVTQRLRIPNSEMKNWIYRDTVDHFVTVNY